MVIKLRLRILELSNDISSIKIVNVCRWPVIEREIAFLRISRHFDAKLPPEYFDAKLSICITLPDEPGEVSKQIVDFRMC
jgi:hypothetical protein